MRRPSLLASLCTVLTSGALFLTACSDSGETGTVTVVETVTAQPGAEVPASENGGGDAAPGTASAGGDCADADLDLTETSLGMAFAQEMMATDTRDFWFHNRVSDNQFDPCLPLSWITLHGALGDSGGPAGTGSSVGDAVVFFHFDEVITDPLPPVVESVESTRRIDDGTIEIVYGWQGGTTAGGVTETLTVEHTFAGGEFTTNGPDGADFVAKHESHVRLDVAAAPLGSDVGMRPLGNVRGSMASRTITAENGDGDFIIVDIPMGSDTLTCSFPNFQAFRNSGRIPSPACTSPDAAWPAVTVNDVMEAQGAALPPGEETTFEYQFMPISAYTLDLSTGVPGSADETLPDDAISLVNATLVDTTGDTVVISNGRSGIRVSPTDLEPTSVDYFDTSRWP